jgi:hypothetical protein
MKPFPLLCLALGVMLLVTGCARYYNITTNNGRLITSRGKPHYDKPNSVYQYTDVRGERRTIPAGSVKQIAPASDKPSPTSFNAQPAR